MASYYEARGRSYYLHRAVRLHFVTLGDQIFLLVEPCIMFTSDGRTPITSERFQSLSTKFTHNQYNALILNDVRFWATFLRNSAKGIMISGMDHEIVIDIMSIDTQMNFGYKEETTREEKVAISEELQFDPQSIAEEMEPETPSEEEKLIEGEGEANENQ